VSFASGGINGSFNHHRPIDGQQRGRPLCLQDQPLGGWRPRSDPERPVQRDVNGRSRPDADIAATVSAGSFV